MYLSKYRTFFFNYSSIYFFFKIMEIHKKNIILILDNEIVWFMEKIFLKYL